MSLKIRQLALAAGASLLILASAVAVEPIEPADDAPQPHSPEESLQLFRVEPGFHVELVAAEPHLVDPTAIAFDADGRIFACEMHGYNLEGHLDVQELNKTGKLDTTVRRIPAPDWAIKKAEEMMHGTVKLLVDDDGDGRVDRSTVFADRLPPCYGVAAAGDGVVVLCAPHILYLADRDGDGKAEIRQTLFTGFNEGELWSRMNHLIWGEDNWLYVCGGRGGVATITGPQLKTPVRLGAVCFRFKADGSALEPITGAAGGFGLGMSDWGDRMLIGNSINGTQITPIAQRYLERNPNTPSPDAVFRSHTYNRVFPISQPHPWRAKRGSQAAWRKLYGDQEATPNGFLTAACSPTFYRGETFPEAFRGNLFVCESQQNLINRSAAIRQGSRIRLERPAGFNEQEFLASVDGWFRPVNLANGPDGSLYVVDMYREIIEDYSAIPRYLQQQYGLTHGDDRGRIWRVVADGKKPTRQMKLSTATTAQLVAAVADRDFVWRETAQRLLVERQDRAAVAGLEAIIVGGSQSPQAKLHALYTLDGLGATSAEALLSALDDEHFAVRLHALRLADRRFGESDALLTKAAAMVDDGDAAVRLQLALSLGEADDGKAAAAMMQLAERRLDEPWIDSALLSASPERAGRMLVEILRSKRVDSPADRLIGPLSAASAVGGDERRIALLLSTVSKIDSRRAAAGKACLEGLLDGWKGRKLELSTSQPIRRSLGEVFDRADGAFAESAFRLAVALDMRSLPGVERMFDAAVREALDQSLESEKRLAAINRLNGADYRRVARVAGELLDVRQPIEIQLAAIAVAARTTDAEAGRAMLAQWNGQSPRVREATLDAIFASSARLPALLDAIERGDVDAGSLGAFRRVQLLEYPDDAVRRRAAKLNLKGQSDGEIEKTLVRYRATLGGKRDLARGGKIFLEQCAKCHRLGEQGHEVGPPLASAMARSDEGLLVAILDPSAEITQGYRPYSILTHDGRLASGILASESAGSVTLRREKGEEETILRRDVDQITAGSKSLMPDGIEKQIAPDELADLLAYLRQTLGAAAPTRAVLFDDEADFPDRLPNGDGKAQVVAVDPFYGAASLSVTPPQRFSAKIEGWNYRIAEQPKPGEFRYLRFTWRSPEGKGVMLELAASGRWPKPKQPERRYFSGENLTGWAARQVSPTVPRGWTTTTVDLWKDCGAFTLTGIAPTAMGGEAMFDRIELLGSLSAAE